MIVSLDKKYRTRRGDEVELHDIVLRNSAGFLVTFPVKGTILVPLKKSTRVRRQFTIWTMDGRESAFVENNLDLVEVEP
jgi:hypothetical protein